MATVSHNTNLNTKVFLSNVYDIKILYNILFYESLTTPEALNEGTLKTL